MNQIKSGENKTLRQAFLGHDKVLIVLDYFSQY